MHLIKAIPFCLQTLPLSCPLEIISLHLQLPALSHDQVDYFDDSIWTAIDRSCCRSDLTQLYRVAVKIFTDQPEHYSIDYFLRKLKCTLKLTQQRELLQLDS